VPGGRAGRGFGYERDGRTIVPAEAAAIREAARRVLAGDTLAGICADLRAAGITGPAGNAITRIVLKGILTRPRTAGLIKDGVPGNWEPVLDRDTWELVRAELAARSARPAEITNVGKYLLSGIAVCAYCGKGLQRAGKAGTRGLRYACVTKGCEYKVRRNMALLDAYVTGRIIGLLNDPAFLAALRAAPVGDPVAAKIQQLETRQARLRELVENIAEHPEQDYDLGRKAIASFDRRIAELREAMATTARTHLLTAHAGITRETFEAMPLSARRALVAACYRITVRKASTRGPGFGPADVDMELVKE
jgi:site-specific DNA recombinase